jgi:CRISPR-associated exonuclease Cas4
MDEADLIPLSALQHYVFCPRQCALIHVEQVWAENRFTAEGRLLHERVDQPSREQRLGVRIARAVPLRSFAFGISGIADVVEFRPQPYPVEYKRGKPKAHRADEVQLCAQALCLEEMLEVHIPEGALFYGQQRRRQIIAMDDELRALTQRIAAETRHLIESLRTPAPEYQPRRCQSCSLIELCQPQQMEKPIDVEQWINHQIKAE